MELTYTRTLTAGGTVQLVIDVDWLSAPIEDITFVKELYDAFNVKPAPATAPPTARHVRGSGCCQLVPACRRCNYGRGAALGNRRRRRSSPTRLAPGSGSL